jgi:hypothetical protein
MAPKWLLFVVILAPNLSQAFTQDGGWSPWSKLETPCQKSSNDTTLQDCGGGVRIRYRSCTMPVPQGIDSKPCGGEESKYESCNLHRCMLPEGFLWSSWSKCTAFCGRGTRLRHTLCGNVRSKYSMGPPPPPEDTGTGTTITDTPGTSGTESTTTVADTNATVTAADTTGIDFLFI